MTNAFRVFLLLNFSVCTDFVGDLCLRQTSSSTKKRCMNRLVINGKAHQLQIVSQ